MVRPLLVAAVLAVGATSVLAQSAAIGDRQKLMKAIGGATGVAGKMLKGEQAFELAKAKESLAVYVDGAKKMKALFPEDSKTGGDTAALPAVWTNRAGFDAAIAKFEADATAASAKITDEASFKTEMPKVLANCGGCHQDYRAKK